MKSLYLMAAILSVLIPKTCGNTYRLDPQTKPSSSGSNLPTASQPKADFIGITLPNGTHISGQSFVFVFDCQKGFRDVENAALMWESLNTILRELPDFLKFNVIFTYPKKPASLFRSLNSKSEVGYKKIQDEIGCLVDQCNVHIEGYETSMQMAFDLHPDRIVFITGEPSKELLLLILNIAKNNQKSNTMLTLLVPNENTLGNQEAKNLLSRQGIKVRLMSNLHPSPATVPSTTSHPMP